MCVRVHVLKKNAALFGSRRTMMIVQLEADEELGELFGAVSRYKCSSGLGEIFIKCFFVRMNGRL